MIKLPEDVLIYLAVQPINMRKSFDGIAVLIQEVLKQNPLNGHLFVFRNKAADKIKIKCWDRNGFSIYYRRLEKGRIKFPKLNKTSVTFSHFPYSTLTQMTITTL